MLLYFISDRKLWEVLHNCHSPIIPNQSISLIFQLALLRSKWLWQCIQRMVLIFCTTNFYLQLKGTCGGKTKQCNLFIMEAANKMFEIPDIYEMM